MLGDGVGVSSDVITGRFGEPFEVPVRTAIGDPDIAGAYVSIAVCSDVSVGGRNPAGGPVVKECNGISDDSPDD